MQSSVLSSTFFLTLLMMIGLVFFIRASTKERIEVVQFAIAQSTDACLEQLQSYFLQRSYQAVESVDVNPSTSTAAFDTPSSAGSIGNAMAIKRVFEGFVRPSLFLALLLLLLAGIGFLCLALVLSIILPQLGAFVWALVLLAPAASLFYWKKSSRIEQVSFKVEPFTPKPGSATGTNVNETKVTVRGHRDELASLQQALTQQSLSIRALEPDVG